MAGRRPVFGTWGHLRFALVAYGVVFSTCALLMRAVDAENVHATCYPPGNLRPMMRGEACKDALSLWDSLLVNGAVALLGVLPSPERRLRARRFLADALQIWTHPHWVGVPGSPA